MKRPLASLLALAFIPLLPHVSSAEQAVETSPETSREQVEQCVSQHDNARQLRVREEWRDARTAMLACADERCPLVIGADCRAWLEELGRVLPTLLLVVERDDPAADWSTLRIELDGQVIQLPDPPVPVEHLPGSHRLRVELGGHAPIERTIVLQKGEKNHLEQLRFASPRSVPVLARTPRATRPVQLSTYLLSAGALSAFAASVALLASGLRERADAKVNCAPSCKTSVRRSIETRLVLADVTGGVGLVLGGLAVYTFVRRPVLSNAARTLTPLLAANGGGVTLIWRGQF